MMSSPSVSLWGQTLLVGAFVVAATVISYTSFVLPAEQQRQAELQQQRLSQWQYGQTQLIDQLLGQASVSQSDHLAAGPGDCIGWQGEVTWGSADPGLVAQLRQPLRWLRPAGLLVSRERLLMVARVPSHNDQGTTVCWFDWQKWSANDPAISNVYQLNDSNTPRPLRELAFELIQQQRQFGISGQQPVAIISDIQGNPRLVVTFRPIAAPPSATELPLVITLGAALTALIALTLMIQLRLLRPLTKLAGQLSSGQPLAAAYSSPLIQRLGSAYLMLQHQLRERDTQYVAVTHQLQQFSAIDPLTGIANRARFDQFSQHEWQRCSFHNHSFSLICIHISDWQQQVGSLSPTEADQRLRALATTLEGNIHRATDLVARIAPDLFAIALPDTGEAGAERVKAKLSGGGKGIVVGDQLAPIQVRMVSWSGIAGSETALTTVVADLVHQITG